MALTNRVAMHFIAAFLIAAAAGALGLRVASLRATPSTQQDLQLKQLAKFRASGLREAALVTGSFVSEIEYPSVGGPASLKELADLSHLIVVGIPESNAYAPTADGRGLVTLFRVRVESVLKGQSAGDVLTVIVLGGKEIFQDGTSAELITPALRRPQTQHLIAFFLRRASGELTAGNEKRLRGAPFVPTAGSLGMYDLSNERGPWVQPAGYYNSPLARSIYKQKLTPTDFLNQVRTAVGK